MDIQKADYKQVISEVIRKQMIILGPDITLSRARNVKGLKVDDSGKVLELSGPPQKLIEELINQFVQLSGLIVQKTMEPILANYPQNESSPEVLSSIATQIHSNPIVKSQDNKSKEEIK